MGKFILKCFRRLLLFPSSPACPTSPGVPLSPFLPAGPGSPTAPLGPGGPASPGKLRHKFLMVSSNFLLNEL